MRYTCALAVAIAGTVASRLGAQGTNACALLTTKELSDAAGVAVREGRPSTTLIENGPAKGETMYMCQWRAGANGMISVSTIRALKAEQRAAGLARINQAFAALKARGWTEQTQSFGADIKCSMVTPPAGESAKTPAMTGCMGEARGQGVGVGFSQPGASLPIAKVKSLFDKAVARL
jgi:hypothetical protein